MEEGGFTLPGEAGYERLTLDLAKKWGADCIRDSDGTQLSKEILDSGIPVYSTLCIVRAINSWAKAHPHMLQRNFLITEPYAATGDALSIDPLDGFFRQQFCLTPSDDPKAYWQVHDRTAGTLHEKWSFDGTRVQISGATPGHLYTVSFLATRLWEEISMYNHITNQWGDRERLMAVEPRYPEAREELLRYLEQWLEDHPATKVVRFTSLFYNFCWIWGDDAHRRSIFTDWGSYDFSVNPVSLAAFQAEYGYPMLAEDFVNQGRYRAAHNPPTQKQRDWMAFTGKFVREFGKKLVDMVHRHGKLAYVFYDDSWIGLEPWSGHFEEFGFDGLIKCVFNAFEARLCAGVPVGTHELRLHPYLFPTGLTGEPTFAPGGHPEADAKRYWACVRRALLHAKIDRIGLGGYLHLVEPFPAFCDEMASIADEFRVIRALHTGREPWKSRVHVAVLHGWGSLRTWNCAGHMHEHPELPLNHIHEALAGLPFRLRSISFEEVMECGVPEDVNVILNAGREGDVWSGGDVWLDPRLKEALNRFLLRGGGFIGVGEPSAARGGYRFFQMADALGVDKENGGTICFERYRHEVVPSHFITAEIGQPAFANHNGDVYALGGKTQVLAEINGQISVATNEFGDGRSVYLSGFSYSALHTRLLHRAILWAAHAEEEALLLMPDHPSCECAFFPETGRLALINNSDEAVSLSVRTPFGLVRETLPPMGLRAIG